MSIVLVIIGLIVDGVLVGQNLIASTSVRAHFTLLVRVLCGVTVKKVVPSKRELPRLPRRSMLLEVWFKHPEA
jgi:hypothetical protein